MTEGARETLRELVALHGESMLEHPARCRALLLDHCEGRLEVSLLTMALEEDIPRLLRGNSDGTPTAVLLDRLSRHFEAARGLAPDSARWAVESWALAVGVGQAPTPLELTEQASADGGGQPPSPPARATETGAADGGVTAEPEQREFLGWRRGPAVAVLLSAVLVLGVAGLAAFRAIDDPPPTTLAPPLTTQTTQVPPSSPNTTARQTTTVRPSTPPTTIEPVGEVFRDDFSKPSSGWRVLDTADAKYAYADGGYRVTLRRGNSRRMDAPVETLFKPTGRFTNDALTIEAKVTFRPTSGFVYAGLSCRGKTTYTGYRAEVRGDGFWSIVRFDGSGPTGTVLAQASGQSEYASDVAGAGPHQLRLDCLGKPEGPVTLSFSVNGYKLKDVTDADGLPPGLINLTITLSASAPTETAEVLFDDFVVTRRQP